MICGDVFHLFVMACLDVMFSEVLFLYVNN